MKPRLQKRDGGWQVVLPQRPFGFTPDEPTPVVLVEGMPRPADCCSFLRTYFNLTVHEGYFDRADAPRRSGYAGEGFRPVVH